MKELNSTKNKTINALVLKKNNLLAGKLKPNL
jgi:hypothetical protein